MSVMIWFDVYNPRGVVNSPIFDWLDIKPVIDPLGWLACIDFVKILEIGGFQATWTEARACTVSRELTVDVTSGILGFLFILYSYIFLQLIKYITVIKLPATRFMTPMLCKACVYLAYQVCFLVVKQRNKHTVPACLMHHLLTNDRIITNVAASVPVPNKPSLIV